MTRTFPPACRFCAFLVLVVALLDGCVPASPYATSTVDPAAERRVAENPGALERIGMTALRSGDPNTAATFFDRALALAPSDEKAARGAAQAAAASGHVDEAVDTLRRTASRAKGDGRASLDAALGKLLVLNHQPAEAEAAFRDGLRSAPDSAKLLTGLGISLDGQHRFPEAMRSFQAALRHAPDDLPAHNDLALSMALAGDPETALRLLRALRVEAEGGGAPAAVVKTIIGNIALVQAMRGDLVGAEVAGADAVGSHAEATRNAAFYQALVGTQSPGASNGLFEGVAPLAGAD